MPPRRTVVAWGGDAGESPVTAVVGVAIFLLFLLVSAQTLTFLYAASTVQAAAFDVATRAAGAVGRAELSQDPAGAVARLDDRAAELVGPLYDEAPAAGISEPLRILPADLACLPVPTTDATAAPALIARVRVPNPSLLVAGLGLGDVVREACVLVEVPSDA